MRAKAGVGHQQLVALALPTLPLPPAFVLVALEDGQAKGCTNLKRHHTPGHVTAGLPCLVLSVLAPREKILVGN